MTSLRRWKSRVMSRMEREVALRAAVREYPGVDALRGCPAGRGVADAALAPHRPCGREEGLAIHLGLEAEHVIGEQGAQERAVRGQGPQHLEAREGHVQEEADGGAHAAPAQLRAQGYQVV